MIDRTYETLVDIAMTPEIYGEEPADLTHEPDEVNAWGPFVVEAADLDEPYLASRLRCRWVFELQPAAAFVTTWISERQLAATSEDPPLLEHGDQLAWDTADHGRIVIRPVLTSDGTWIQPTRSFRDRNELLVFAEEQLGLREPG